MPDWLKRISLSYVLISTILGIGLLLLILVFIYPIPGLPNREAATRLYFADNISEAHRLLIERFNREYSGRIEVVPINLPFTKFSTNERKVLLARSLRSRNDQIDVFAVDLIWVPRFARWAEPLDMFFGPEPFGDILPEALASCYHNDRVVAMPLYIDVGVLYYRRDLLERFPDPAGLEARLQASITWEELISLRESEPDADFPLYLFPAKNYEGLMCSFVELLHGRNGSMFAGDSVQLNTAAARESLQLLSDLVNRYGVTPRAVTEYEEIDCYNFILDRKSLAVRGWPGFIRQFDQAGRSEVFPLLRRAPLPHFEGTEPASVFGGWNLMISKYSKKKPAAREFISFLLRPDNQRLLFDRGGYIPVNRRAYADSTFMARYPELRFYRRILDQGIHRPYTVDYTQISDVVSYYLHQAIKGNMTVDAALATATEHINANKVILR